jgi:hypothetical protein
MGVNTFLLDRRTAILSIGGSRQTVGTLRRSFKLTELDAERSAEREAAANITPSPVAVLLMDISELALAADPGKPITSHLVLGWDEGRGSVTDFGWDYLPRLGYAVRNPVTSEYTLYEECDGLLHGIDASRARELGILDGHGALIPHGQPHIIQCKSGVRHRTGRGVRTPEIAPAMCQDRSEESSSRKERAVRIRTARIGPSVRRSLSPVTMISAPTAKAAAIT